MVMVSEDMAVDAVDQNDVPVGVIQRDQVFTRHANFRVAHILIFNSGRELLVQQLARTRPRHPGYWGSSVAAYLFAGESYNAAADRRLTDELGIHGLQLEFIGKTAMEDEGAYKFIGVFAARSDGPFSFDTSHIDRLEFLPTYLIHEMHDADLRQFTPTFLRVLRFYESRM